MAKRLDGKRVFLSGGTTGIGKESARRFLAEGAKVFITGSRDQSVRNALADLGAGASGTAADVRDVAAVEAAAKEGAEWLGGLDVVFANAGLGVFAPIGDIDEAGYDKQFDINVKGVFFTVQACLPHVVDKGSIILTASAVHKKGIGTGTVYFASKAAVRSFARTMAAELGGRGIRVNALSPGIVRTDFSKKVNIPEDAFGGFMDMVVSQAPLGREGTPMDMANAALFLASDEAAYITGADLLVDGGWMSV